MGTVPCGATELALRFAGVLQDGDIINIDAEKRVMDVELSDAEWARRRAAWQAPPLKATSGTLYKYIKNVTNASVGCVTDT